MDDSAFGTEDSRGYWKPHKRLRYPDVFVWPVSLRGILAWLPGYLFPWTALYAALTLVVFFFLTPATARMQEVSSDWVALIALRNYALLIAVVGVQHYWLYVRKAQGTAFKYNRRWPQPRNPAFTFNNQTRDNLFWSHHIHHRNINPGPWSGLSMHPVEHLLYFSGFAIYFVLPAHPLHFVNMSLLAGLSPAQGHTGFDRVQTGGGGSIDTSYYAHYLHHRYFEVNYADGTIPIDKWFGTFHDGTPEGDAALRRRRLGGSA